MSATCTDRNYKKLWMAVGQLLVNAEDPKYVKTATAMVGTKNLAALLKTWERLPKPPADK